MAAAKADSGPDTWPRDLGVDWKLTAQRWRAIKKKYSLRVSAYEDAVLRALWSE